MNEPSVFQVQYPLSPRKFWKKIIPNLITYFILSLVIGVGFSVSYGISHNIDFQSLIPLYIFSILGIYVIIIFLNAWYIKAYIKRYYYDCGEQFVTIKKGVFAPTEIHVQYQKIQDVYVDQDILDRIMGLYDVHIASATVLSGIEAHIDGVTFEVAENLKNIILGKIHTGNNPSAPMQAFAPQTVQPQINSVQLTQKISSVTYPINGTWVFVAIIGALGYSIFLTFFLGFIFIGIMQSVGISSIYFLCFFLAVFFLRLIWLMLWKSNYYFELTPDYILLRTGVVSRSENHLPYKSIQNITNKQSIAERICGLATVVVQNAAQVAVQTRRGASSIGGVNISMIGQPKAKADELNNILNDIVSKINSQNQGNNMGL